MLFAGNSTTINGQIDVPLKKKGEPQNGSEKFSEKRRALQDEAKG